MPAIVAMGHLTGFGVSRRRLALRVGNTTIRQVRTIRYREIAEDLRRRVDAGEFAAGRLLPSEAELSGAYSASRVTIRKALEELRGEGLIAARQGFGWFAADETVRQSLGHLARWRSSSPSPAVDRNARSWTSGSSSRRPRVRQVLGVDKVLQVRRLSLADGHPFARVTVWCPEELGARAEPGAGRAALRSTTCCRSTSEARCSPSARTPPTPRRRAARDPGGIAGPRVRADHVRRGRPSCVAGRVRLSRPT